MSTNINKKMIPIDIINEKTEHESESDREKKSTSRGRGGI
jgi:hypothetical protein